MTRENDSNSTRSGLLLLLLVAAVFVLSRLWVLNWAPIQTSTVGLFTETGYEYRYAQAHHESVYAVHERKIRDELAQQQSGGPPVDPSRLRLEYPPLATWAMTLPTYFAPPVGDDWELTPEHFARAKIAFRWMMAAIDTATFVALAFLLRRLYPGQPLTQAMRLLVYTVGGLALFHVLYDRFDLVAGSFMLIAMSLLLGRAHWAIALAALAVATHLKLVPVLLAPVFVVGCMRRGPGVASMIKPALVLVGWCVLIGLPFVVSSGSDALGFLAYHAERGVQVESLPATVLLLAGKVTNLELSHGAIDVASPWSPAAASISTWLGLLAAAGIALATVRCGIRQRAGEGKTVAQSHPFMIVVLAVLILFASLCAAKVFSPQYLLWLLPLVPLLPGRRWWVLQIVFLLMCALTTYIFPYRYWSDVARITDGVILPPTALGISLLAVRNGILIGLTIALAAIARGIARPARVAIEGNVGSG